MLFDIRQFHACTQWNVIRIAAAEGLKLSSEQWILTTPAAGQKLMLSIAKRNKNAAFSIRRDRIGTIKYQSLALTDDCVRVVIQVSQEFLQKPETANARFEAAFSAFGSSVDALFQPVCV